MTGRLNHKGVIDKQQGVERFDLNGIVQCFGFSIISAVAQADGLGDGGVKGGGAVGQVVVHQRVFACL